MPVAAGLYYSYSDSGTIDRPPIILIHGAGGSHQSWHPNIRRMAGRRILALDLTGHGKSEGAACQDIDDYVHQILKLLDSLNIYHVILIGHSMGGAIAMQTTLQIPRQVAALGLISTGASMDIVPDLVMDYENLVPPETIYRKYLNRLFSIYIDPKLLKQSMEMLHKIRPSVLYADWIACKNFNIEHQLNKTECPTLIVVGEDDHLTPIPMAHDLVKSIPNNQFEIIPKAGHMVLMEQPDLLATKLQQFLKNLPIIKNFGWIHP